MQELKFTHDKTGSETTASNYLPHIVEDDVGEGLELVLGEAVRDAAADSAPDGEAGRAEDDAAEGAGAAGDEAALQRLPRGHRDLLLVGERRDHLHDVVVPDDHLGGDGEDLE